MIKKFAALTVLSFALSGCTSLGGLSPDAIAKIDQFQAGAIKTCGFMPAIEGAVAILIGPTGMAVDAAINALCQMIPQAPITAARGAAPRAGQPASVVVNGKVVQGIYTR